MALTDKQEKYCQAYVICGNQSTAYREAYDAEDMNSNSVAVAACRVHSDANVTLRIRALQKEANERNKITIDELAQEWAGTARFDPGTLYDEDGRLLPSHQMPLATGQMIQEMQT